MAVDIIIIDDHSEAARKLLPKLRAVQEYAETLTISAANYDHTIPLPDFETNRQARQRNQPFYRGLKKYRKP